MRGGEADGSEADLSAFVPSVRPLGAPLFLCSVIINTPPEKQAVLPAVLSAVGLGLPLDAPLSFEQFEERSYA